MLKFSKFDLNFENTWEQQKHRNRKKKYGDVNYMIKLKAFP